MPYGISIAHIQLSNGRFKCPFLLFRANTGFFMPSLKLDDIVGGYCYRDKEGVYRVYAWTSDNRVYLMNVDDIKKKERDAKVEP